MKNEIVLKPTTRQRLLRRLLFLLVIYGSVATSAMAGVVIKGNVYGGGNAASVGTTGQGDSAVVNISNPDATVWGQVYGGCNSEGSVIGTAVVNITAGIVGKPDTIQNVVFGGGKGQNTLVEGSVVVNIGKTVGDSATIWGHVYGGSALGNVNAEKLQNDSLARVGDSTTVVNIISGTIVGDIYGGGLGFKDEHDSIAANVYGRVTVNIGTGTVDAAGFATSTAGNATIGRSVYGCNNLNGTPKDSVFVNVYKTAHTKANRYPQGITTLEKLDSLVGNTGEHYRDSFAIAAVYGGGNQASYSPKDDTDTTTVHVYACEENTIHTLYGGGNAADATNVKVIIDGGFIDRVFGGGNGYSATGNHNNPNGEDYNPGADISGSATTEIHGGLFRQIFGGSNQWGNVAKVALSIDNESHCTELIHESFGGANEAEIRSDVTTTLACSQNKIGTFYGGSNMADINGNVTLNVEGGTYLNVFGGSKGTKSTAADISGDVTLNLYGGTMTNAFGGSDVNGNITGKITVNVLDKGGDCGLQVDSIYGGGRDAAYTPTTPGAYPEVNLIHGKISGNVFGGGLGSSAIVTSNPKVTVGYVARTSAMVDSLVALAGASFNDTVVVRGDVYGGGSAAAVTGKATVILQDSCCSVSNLFGGGKAAGVSDSTWVTMTAGTVTNAVYGGCNTSGTVGGAPTVTVTGGTIGTAYASAPTSMDDVRQVLFGGGKGKDTDVTGKITLNVGTKTGSDYAGTAHIYGNVYGGSENGKVSNVDVFLYGDTIHGNVFGGGYDTDASLAHGDTLARHAHAADTVSVVLDGTLLDRSNAFMAQIFGCNNKSGTPQGPVTVHVMRTVGSAKDEGTPVENRNVYDIAAVYGGGNMADYVPRGLNDSTRVIIDGCNSTSIENVYGGGNAAAVSATEVIIMGAYIINNVFGGGNGAGYMDPPTNSIPNPGANVGSYISGTDSIPYGTGRAVTRLLGGNINSVFGGSNTKGNIHGGAKVYTINEDSSLGSNCRLNVGKVYGGGSQADMAGGTEIVLSCMPDDWIGEIYAGAKSADVGNDVSLTITSGKFGRVFGGNMSSGKIDGSIIVNIEENPECETPIVIGELYGGGFEAPYSVYGYGENGQLLGKDSVGALPTPYPGPIVNVRSFTSIGNIYGGGYGETATVVGEPTVNINEVLVADTVKAYNPADDRNKPSFIDSVNVTLYPHTAGTIGVIGNVFGGGNAAKVIGATHVNVSTGDSRYNDGSQLKVRFESTGDIHEVAGADIRGNVYGGGNLADVTDSTYVTINGGTIAKNVFGGGKGVADNFTCDKAMVGVNDSGEGQNPDSDDNKNKGTHVTISNGTVNGSVYGGGEVGRVEWNTHVTIGVENGTSEPVIEGSVFGAGAGVETHGYSALVRGNSTVDVQGNARVKGNVYGGGEKASGGRYYVKGFGDNPEESRPANYDDIPDGMPYKSKSGGSCTVNILGYAVIGPDAKATATAGHVFGAGKGVEPHFIAGISYRIDNTGNPETFNIESKYLEYLQTLALVINTHVNIGDDVTVKGNVYGGSESGFVQDSTNVNILGGTIGTDTLGNVFGGGKGLDDFAEAGIVKGNTKVTIGGSTTTSVNGNVYGGGELGDVSEKTEVIISGGTIAKNVYGGGKGKGDNFTCDKAMVGINDEGKNVEDPGDDEYKDKGTHVTISNGTIGTLDHDTLVVGTGNVYGGGEVGRVEWNTQVEIGVDDGTPTIYGDVFGAGAGLKTHGYSALVRGNSTVTIDGSAEIRKNVYGGGEIATVGRYWVKNINNKDSNGNIIPAANPVPVDLPSGMPYKQQSGGICRVTVQGNAQIGPANGNATATAGHVFGAGKGVSELYDADTSKKMTADRGLVGFDDDPNKTAEEEYYEFLQTLALASYTNVNIEESAIVKGSVYGGSESGFVQDSTDVNILGGTIGTDTLGNVFGGGKGFAEFAESGKVKGNTKVTISDGTMRGNVYGGGELGDVGTINKANINNYVWTDSTGICAVIITGGQVGPDSGNGDVDHGNVFGAGKGSISSFECEKAMVDSTRVSISGDGTVKRNVYGGGQLGRVEHNTGVTIGSASGNDAPEISGDVFGAGAGVGTHGYSALVRGNANVLVQGKAKVRGNVYGGGEIASVGKYWVTGVNYGDLPHPEIPVELSDEAHTGMPYAAREGGKCIVIVKGGAQIGPGDGATEDAGHVFGAGKGVIDNYNNTENDPNRSSRMNDQHRYVYFNNRDAYLLFLETLALATDTYVEINDTAKVKGSVYGGSGYGFVQQNTDVRIKGGTVGNVYGGGKGLTTFAEAGKVKGSTSIKMTSGNVLGSMFGGCNASGTIVEDVAIDITGGTIGAGIAADSTINGNKSIPTLTYTSKAEVHGGGYGEKTYVKGNVTVNIGARTGRDSTAECSGTAVIYGDVYGGGALGHVNAYDSLGLKYNAAKKTIISLNKGDIYGNVYGGGLGNDATRAYVGGDVEVTQYDVAYYTSYETTGSDTDLPIPMTGRIFGCNNLNGTPQGNVTVEVWKTRRLDNGDHKEENYEIQAVYSGGNRAEYEPSDGKKTQVKIHGCPDTMIESVYGGGNAADVPASMVSIFGAREIESVFGGGNGSEKTKQADGTWAAPKAANIKGDANVILYGGNIRSVFGGSNTTGNIGGTATVTDMTEQNGGTQLGECDLRILNVYGGGRSADMEGDVNLFITGCNTKESVENIYGGSYSAKINGNVTLTVTGGVFYKVFGGNDQGGHINGRITVNLEEADNCKPLIISNLYGGGNEANYPGAGASQESGTITVNIKSCTRIDNVYGGALNANVKGNTNLNINLTKGAWAGKDFILPSQYKGTHDIPNIKNNTIENAIGTIGNVYGGGDNGKIIGNTNVNIGTETEVFVVDTSVVAGTNVRGKYAYGTYTLIDKDSTAVEDGHYYVKKTVDGARITGNVFGGGKLADVGDYEVVTNNGQKTDNILVVGHTNVNICAVGDSIRDDANQATGELSYTSRNFSGEGKLVEIGGDVYGGGEGVADDFRCGKAMVTGSTNVHIGNGTVTGSVFGGGKVGRVEQSTTVMVGLTPETGEKSAPVIRGNVFGAGKGVETHGYSALVRGNSTVTIQQKAKVGESVYGGGELASVGRYSVADSAYHSTHPDVGIGMPYSLANPNSGNCYVIVRDSAEIGPDHMQMPESKGNVFGAGKGIIPFKDTKDPKRMLPTDKYEVYGTDTVGYLKYAETLALATKAEVTIGGDAFVKGSVYGGSENGHVQHDTKVMIQDHCQIGAGYDYSQKKLKAKYAATDFVHPDAITDANFLAECNHWPYGKNNYVPYDKYADTAGYTSYASTTGDDGHTYYGNVFGGGSGREPYAPGKWHWEAGSVGGNATVEISGGHILTNVYGGNELTNVEDTCRVTMTGGTIGVPRTLDSIAVHPLTCYLFGAGKGDQRVFFNKQTNVKDVIVDVSGGIIYGSVFGGGEDGHVIRNAKVNIKPGAWIGTWGTSYVDGNVFGGGRGFAGDAYTAGNVADSVVVNITGGTMLGSIYGGGRLGSVGYDMVDAGNGRYGEMSDNLNRGHVVMNISGGKIGNKYEFKSIANNIKIDEAYRKTNHIPSTELDSLNRLTHTKGGNVYAGGMGRFTKLNGDSISLANDGIDWTKLGNVKSTKLSISDSTWIMGNVYGGGELGAVTDSTVIKVTGGVIGTEITAAAPDSTTHAAGTEVAYTFGSIYGGGMGMVMHDKRDNHGGDVASNTHVSISGDDTKVRASVFGGGEMATVGGDTYVDISDGKIGRNEVYTTDDANQGYVKFGGATMGNVFGGGKGHVDHTFAGLVKGNTNISISGGSIYHNVYGGGAIGSVGTFDVAKGHPYIPNGLPLAPWKSGGTARITITGGTIGISGRDNGMVFGSSRGGIAQPVPTTLGSTSVDKDPYDKVAWVYDTEVTIGKSGSAGPNIKGSVYGGGENGHNAHNALVNVYSGNIGIFDGESWYTLTNATAAAEAKVTRGNVYGAGCGTDTYTDSQGKKHHNLWAGIVSVNTEVNVRGGHVARNVYGAGSMGSVGTIISDIDSEAKWHKTATDDDKETYYGFGLSWPIEIEYVDMTGLARVNVADSAIVEGSVYGAARGKVDIEENDITRHRYVEAKFANVRQTEVNIGEKGTPVIKEDVFGGGEDGHVYDNAVVYIHNGTVAHSVYGGGKGEGTYMATLWEPKDGAENDISQHQPKSSPESIHSMVAGKVYGNTTVTILGGHVGWFVYGGGNLGSVGKGNYAGGADDYATGGYGELPEDATANLWTVERDSTMAWHFLNSGVATVNLFGGEIGTYKGEETANFDPVDQLPYGSVFGGSRGKSAMDVGQRSPRYRYVPDFFLGYVNKAVINVGDTSATATGDGPKIYGSIYGGGQDGHVRNSTHINLFKGEVTGHQIDAAARSGHVFGAGSGIGTYLDTDGKQKVSFASGSVTGTTTIEVYDGAKIKGNIWGGGAMAAIGPPKMGTDEGKEPSGTRKSFSYTKVDVKGGEIGGTIYGASRGPSAAFRKSKFTDIDVPYDSTKFATDIWSEVIVRGGTIGGSVYGGGESGQVKCGVNVNILGGKIGSDVYGGGALAHTNTSNLKQDRTTHQWGWSDSGKTTGLYTTTVNLLGGTIQGNAYGGALGRRKVDDPVVTPVEAKVYGDIKVNLNGIEKTDSASIRSVKEDVKSWLVPTTNGHHQVNSTRRGAAVGRVFGCNNLNGSPQGKVRVHVFATQKDSTDNIITKYPKFGKRADYTLDSLSSLTALAGRMNLDVSSYSAVVTSAANDSLRRLAFNTMIDAIAVKKYDVRGVYGGGNLAAYMPMGPNPGTDGNGGIIHNNDLTKQSTDVIIDGCELTSIYQVYGGGNAAPVPAAHLVVNGTYEIDEAFGGGNGADSYWVVEGNDTVWYQNPGANVGYKDFTEVVKDASHDGKTEATAYLQSDVSTALTPEMRKAGFSYGDQSTAGVATTIINGGKIHVVYGGSNKRGNISTTALSQYEGASDCPMDVDETYGAGKDAPIDGVIDMRLKCAKGVKEMFGGSKNSDVNSDINLKITNGSSLERVFGGNNTSGAVNGSITVTIEEGGCEPIRIKELYAGGYLAPYSIYGYAQDGRGGYKVDTIDYGGTIGKIEQRIPITKSEYDTLYKPMYERLLEIDLGKMGCSGTVPTEAQIQAILSDNSTDSTKRVATLEYVAIRDLLASLPKKHPRINVISATRIDTIYGGGYQAIVVGNPRVNVNMTNGKVEVTETADGKFVDASGTEYPAETVDTNLVATLPIGTIGHIFGGGNMANIDGNTFVEIGTGEWLNQNDQREMLGTITVNAKDTTMLFTYDDSRQKWTYTQESGDSIVINGVKTARIDTIAIDATPTPFRRAATITGNVFGGGRGVADNFFCDKAMIGTDGAGVDKDFNDIPDYLEGNTSVTIANGRVKGNVYGGGEIGRVEKNTTVTIGLEDDAGEPVIEGDVYGAGKGVETHGYSALVRGNPTVIVQGKAKVGHSVYGGGQTASVARYKVVGGSPVALANSTSGNCKVIVRGEAEIGPDSMVMTKPGGPDDTGYVFGAGKGVIPGDSSYIDKDHMPKRMILRGDDHTDALQGKTWEYVYPDDPTNKNIWEYFPNDSIYLSFIETLALSSKTDVTIGGHAFIKGAVYGGSENGLVQYDTHVRIQDSCQIGNGYVQMDEDGTLLDTPMAMNRRYTAQEWKEGRLIMGDDDRPALRELVGTRLYQHSLPECASWPYEAPYAPYDRLADADGLYPDGTDARGGRISASDGHTFYGNVFGGGSGLYPYKPGKWHRAAGLVRGNTVVDVTGGHILTSLYGGNEMTDVGTYSKDSHGELTVPDTCGMCTVNMVGGTLGVPRTLGQIAAHPVTCYLFGAGKGDTRTFFNTWTNVDSVKINISGNARIYGSTFGGGEDGHILGSAVTNIGLPVTLNIDGKDSVFTERGVLIGTTGYSYVDGNVFGAGRGFSGEAITAGSVGGNVEVNIGGGTMLGSIYGGGRLASVGIGFNTTDNVEYGSFTNDVPGDSTKTYGHVTVNISGGTIGHDSIWTQQYGGNVFGGSMGRLTHLDNTVNPIWPQLGQVKTTEINITGGTIKRNVYGGGEFGSVRDSAYVNIGGRKNADGTITAEGSPVIERDVYGGGYGSKDTLSQTFITPVSGMTFRYTPMQWAGLVGISTHVNMLGGWVKKSIYGGGELASVGIINYLVEQKADGDYTYFGTVDSLQGKKFSYSKIEKHDDENDGFYLSWPYKFEHFSGYDGSTHVAIRGGRLGLTGKDFMGPFNADGKAISLADGHELTDSEKKEARLDNGDVYGGSKGFADDRYYEGFSANVGSTEVIIEYPDSCTANPDNYKDLNKWCIAGAVYGGGENGHVLGDTHLTLTNGLIGHSLYGGGSGKGQFEQRLLKVKVDPESTNPNDSTIVNIYSITAGKVYGNTHIDMTGGYVVRNIYGGGNMGSIGKGNYAGAPDDYSTKSPGGGYGEKISTNLWDNVSDNSKAFLNSGQTHVTITGGQVGYVDTEKPADSMKDGLPYGNVFGGCRGESAPNITETPRFLYSPQFFSGYTNKSNVTIGTEGQDNSKAGQKGKAPLIIGSVFGGGQDGHVRQDTYVTVNSGQIGLSLDGTDLDTLNNSKTNLNVLGPLYNDDETVNPQWLYRGNVFGAGSGIGQYQFDFTYDGDFDDTVKYGVDRVTGDSVDVNETGYSTSAGSVTRFTNVNVKGGIIYRNVYGGGSLASVGPAKIPATRIDAWHPEDTIANHRDSVGWQSLNSVTIGGLVVDGKVVRPQIGDAASVNAGYGGNIFGGGRGELSIGDNYGTSVWTKVYIKNGANILGNIFGGGDNGTVYKDTDVQIGEPKNGD